ncbi:hypothetical protein [Alkalihalobacterium sp. APHAB7]|uniref:hypothetical protein n=1 Tax=Alkalihalobacterium sp. APHAB7 TaxID=3402081 RepID=UPI003AADB72D
MYKEKFTSYLKIGALAGVITTMLVNVVFILMGLIVGHETNFIGQDRDTLYIVFISFATFMALFLGGIIFYMLQKTTKKQLLWFSIVVLLGFLFNTYTAEVDLHEQYQLTAHILHVFVGGLAIYLIPKLSRERR